MTNPTPEPPDREIWVRRQNGEALCGLINAELGWLMYLAFEGDAGLVSMNPEYSGPTDAVRSYRLANGQRDEYPLSWALPTPTVLRALTFFEQEGKRPEFIHWQRSDGTSA